MSGEMPREPGWYFAKYGGIRRPIQVFYDKRANRLRVVAIGYSDYDELEDYQDYAKAVDPLAKEPQ